MWKQQEGSGCGDAVRLPARGIRRGVFALGGSFLAPVDASSSDGAGGVKRSEPHGRRRDARSPTAVCGVSRRGGRTTRTERMLALAGGCRTERFGVPGSGHTPGVRRRGGTRANPMRGGQVRRLRLARPVSVRGSEEEMKPTGVVLSSLHDCAGGGGSGRPRRSAR